MIRRVLIIVFLGVAVAAAAVGLFVTRAIPAPGEPAADTPPAPAAGTAEPRLAPPPPRPAPAPAAAPVAPPARERRIEPPRELGTLHIDSDVPGASVFIDRKFMGRTPLVIEGVAPGAHRLNVSADGFDGLAETIDVEPGPRELRFRLAEVRLDARLAVVHDHRLGSCEGQLVADPSGIRYETSNENDGFGVPLSQLEDFEVDYLAKTLTLKLAGGRRFTFTDPDDDADRLFVFHRDVERAARRLALGDTPADR